MSFDKYVFKVVAIGDGAIGKTCLLVSYSEGSFPKSYIPTVFDSFQKTVSYNNMKFQLTLFDTAGQEDYDNLRSLAYPDTDLFIICFSLVNINSYENVRTKWAPDLLDNNMGDVPILLVGLKSDLRKDKRVLKELKELAQEPISTEQGVYLGKKIGAFGYIETSAKDYVNVDETFLECVKYIVKKKLKPKPKTKLKIFSSLSSENEMENDVDLFKNSKK